MRVRPSALSAMAGLLSAGLGITLSCNNPVFNCLGDQDCNVGGQAGTCQPSAYCSVDDSSCISGQRYVELAPENLAGECVPGDDLTDTDTDPGSEGGSTFTPIETSAMTSVTEGTSSPTTLPITTGPDTGTTQATIPPDSSSSGGSDSSSTGVIDESLVLWLSFDGDDIGFDSSPQAFPTDCPRASCPVHTDGVSGRAGAFDNTPIFVPDFTDVEINAYTVSFWTKVPTFTFMAIVGLPTGDMNSNSFEAYVYESTPGLLFSMEPVAFTLFLTPIELDTWVHMAATWNGQDFSVFVDGEIVGSEPNTEYLADTHPLVVGADIDTGVLANPLTGEVDELRIYDRALTAEEITNLYENPGG